MRPGASGLPVQLQIEFGNRVRREKGVLASLIDEMPVALGFDLSVDDHEADMYALGSQLSGHALCERA